MVDRADSKVLSLEEKIGRLFFIGIHGTVLAGPSLELIEAVRPGGVCLFARNIKEAVQTRELLDAIRDRLEGRVLLSLDQEGGLVDRLRRIVTPMPAASELRSEPDVRRFAKIVAETVRTLGFNMNFAPVTDVVDGDRLSFNNGLRSRAFGTTPDETASLAGAFLEEMQSHGVLGCIKHFPGLGAAEVDSHEELPHVAIGDSELLHKDIGVIRRIILGGNVHAVMAAHAAYPASELQETGRDGRLLPASLSRLMLTRLLRDRLEFDGVVISDDLEMGAILKNYGIGEACKMAISAGTDMLAICAGEQNIREVFESVRAAVHSGEISEERIDESVRRVTRLMETASEPLPFDDDRFSDISAEIEQLKHSLN